MTWTFTACFARDISITSYGRTASSWLFAHSNHVNNSRQWCRRSPDLQVFSRRLPRRRRLWRNLYSLQTYADRERYIWISSPDCCRKYKDRKKGRKVCDRYNSSKFDSQVIISKSMKLKRCRLYFHCCELDLVLAALIHSHPWKARSFSHDAWLMDGRESPVWYQ